MNICVWILIFGVWYNTQYIKSIKHQTIDITTDIRLERPCLFGSGPCFNNYYDKIVIGKKDEYIIRIANTESAGDDYGPFRDFELKVNNSTQDYQTVTDFIDKCINI